MVASDPDAEDLVQEIFLRALSGWSRFQHRASARTWLWAICRNTLKQYYRERRRERAKLLRLTSHLAPSPVGAGPEESSHIMLEEGLETLTRSQRQVFLLRVVQDLPSREVAELMGWPETRVRVTLYRATKRLATWWHDQGGGKRE